jgi:hypothetical protein
MRVYKPGKYETVVHYENSLEMLTDWHTVPRDRRKARYNQSFTGGTVEDAKRHLEHGALEHVDSVRELWAELDSIETPKTEWFPAVTGTQVVVPNAIAGIPTVFRRKLHGQSEFAPIKIVFSIATSAGVPEYVIRKRGVAVMAFANKLSAHRPVELMVIYTHGTERRTNDSALILCVDIGHSPMNLAKALGVLASGPVDRGMSFDLTWKYTELPVGSIPWAWNAGGQGTRMETNVRRVLNMKPEDLFLGGAYIDDKVAQDPKAWVEKMVQQFKERNTEGIES